MMTKTLVFDFDGTIFKLFVNENRDNDLLEKNNLDTKDLKDIFDVFKMTNDLNILKEANKIVTECELRALKSGEEVVGFKEFVNYAVKNNLKIGVVSNNSKAVIETYFKNNYQDLNVSIVGRDEEFPNLLKPNKYLLDKWISLNKANRSYLIYLGDNKRDYECALNSGVRFIGLTPTSRKRKKMEDALDNVLIFNDYLELLDYLKTL